MLYVTASGSPKTPNTASAPFLIPDDGPTTPPPPPPCPLRLSVSANFVITIVITKQTPNTKFTSPQSIFTPNFPANGSIASETTRRTIELIINPNDPARTPRSYSLTRPGSPCELPPYTSLPIQSVSYRTHGNHAIQLRHVTKRSIHIGRSRFLNAENTLVLTCCCCWPQGSNLMVRCCWGPTAVRGHTRRR
ncbi:unnamed protein product [Linum tenue]|uniref:Uncharacterized protein n=1 Tax=Linum tenue TaxID=586396 RepID=A0AAV0IB04_9ROSI|nr:unnamed protein product [Linum tenue]